MPRKLGFTLAEITIVIIILGVIIGLALPNFLTQIRKVRNQEAIGILTTVYSAQIDYQKENGQFADNVNDLDVSFSGIKNFFFINHLTGTIFCQQGTGGSLVYMGSLKANSNDYTLYILSDGRIVCTGQNGDCLDPICTKMGFRSF